MEDDIRQVEKGIGGQNAE